MNIKKNTLAIKRSRLHSQKKNNRKKKPKAGISVSTWLIIGSISTCILVAGAVILAVNLSKMEFTNAGTANSNTSSEAEKTIQALFNTHEIIPPITSDFIGLTYSISNDEKLLAIDSYFFTNILDVKSGLIIKSNFNNLDYAAISARITPDGKHIVRGYYEGKIVIYNILDNKTIKELDAHKGRVKIIEFSKDSQLMITCCDMGIVSVWNLADYSLVKTFHKPDTKFDSIKLSKDKKLIAAATTNGEISIWALDTGSVKTKRVIAGDSAFHFKVYDFDDEAVLAGWGNSKPFLLDFNKSKIVHECELENSDALGIVNSSFTNDYRSIITVSNNGNICEFDKSTGKLKNKRVIKKHDSFNDGKINGLITTYFVNKESNFVSCISDFNSGKRTIIVNELSTGNLLNTINLSARVVGNIRNIGTTNLYTTYVNGELHTQDLRTGKVDIIPDSFHSKEDVSCIAITDDDTKAFISKGDEKQLILDVKNKKVIQELKLPGFPFDCNITSDFKYLIYQSSADPNDFLKKLPIVVYDLQQNKQLTTINTSERHFRNFICEKNHSVYNSMGSVLGVYDYISGVKMKSFKGISSEGNRFMISSDANYVLATDDQNNIRIYDFKTEQVIYESKEPVNCIHYYFIPETTQIILSKSNFEVELRDFKTKSTLKRLTMPIFAPFVNKLKFTDNKNLYCNNDFQGNCVIYDIDKEKVLFTSVKLSGTTDNVVFTPDGYFDGTEAGCNALKWRKKGDLFPDLNDVEIRKKLRRPSLWIDFLK